MWTGEERKEEMARTGRPKSTRMSVGWKKNIESEQRHHLSEGEDSETKEEEIIAEDAVENQEVCEATLNISIEAPRIIEETIKNEETTTCSSVLPPAEALEVMSGEETQAASKKRKANEDASESKKKKTKTFNDILEEYQQLSEKNSNQVDFTQIKVDTEVQRPVDWNFVRRLSSDMMEEVDSSSISTMLCYWDAPHLYVLCGQHRLLALNAMFVEKKKTDPEYKLPQYPIRVLPYKPSLEVRRYVCEMDNVLCAQRWGMTLMFSLSSG